MAGKTSTTLETTPIPGYERIPIVGNRVNVFRFFADPIGHMFRLEREFGPIAAFTAGDPSLVCAFGSENNRLILSDPSNYRHSLDLPFSVPEGSAAQRIFGGLLSMNGERHKRCRRLLTPTVSKAAVSSYSPGIVNIAERFVHRWISRSTMDIVRDMQEYTMHVMLHCLFGTEPTSELDELGHIGLRMLGLLSSPWTILLPLNVRGTHFARFLEFCEQIDQRIRHFIRERGPDDAAKYDVVSTLLRARDEEEHPLPDDDIVALSLSMLFGGQDPIASTLSWTFVLLSEHPTILADIQSELDDVLHGAPPTENDLQRLPLLDAVIHESMRIFPAIAHLMFRRTSESTQLGKHILPADSVLILSPLVTHRDRDMYPDAKRFQPERWNRIKPGPYDYMPFGAGPRMCIAASFAQHVLRLTLATILQRMRPVLPPNLRIDHQVRAANLGFKSPVPMQWGNRRDASGKPAHVRGSIHDLVALG